MGSRGGARGVERTHRRNTKTGTGLNFITKKMNSRISLFPFVFLSFNTLRKLQNILETFVISENSQ